MKIVVLYHANEPQAGAVEEYVDGLLRRHPDKSIERLDVDSQQGGETAKLYDVIDYPAVLALGDDGAFRQVWQGEPLPEFDQVDFYLRSL